MTADDSLLEEQMTYYRARAAEYDEWWYRSGRYDRGPEHRAAWQREIAIVEQALNADAASGDALEFACGTGLWTNLLARTHRRVVAVDASPEVVDINRSRTASDRIDYLIADLFAWTPPPKQFDTVFFAFWLSHVPPARFGEFWEKVGGALKPGGRAFWVDSLREPASTARDHDPLDTSGVVRRKLNDGREFRIVKVFYEPDELRRRVTDLGFTGWVRSSGRFFHYGCMTPVASVRSVGS